MRANCPGEKILAILISRHAHLKQPRPFPAAVQSIRPAVFDQQRFGEAGGQILVVVQIHAQHPAVVERGDFRHQRMPHHHARCPGVCQHLLQLCLRHPVSGGHAKPKNALFHIKNQSGTRIADVAQRHAIVPARKRVNFLQAHAGSSDFRADS
ncbi:MAG: hypothetical protein ACK56I_13945, partial [bacterium]